jgi:hypothetical protein
MIHGFQLFVQLIPFITYIIECWILFSYQSCIVAVTTKISDLPVYLSALVHYFITKKSSHFLHAKEKYVLFSYKVALLGKLM